MSDKKEKKVVKTAIKDVKKKPEMKKVEVKKPEAKKVEVKKVSAFPKWWKEIGKKLARQGKSKKRVARVAAEFVGISVGNIMPRTSIENLCKEIFDRAGK
jgi:hypothetical protein